MPKHSQATPVANKPSAGAAQQITIDGTAYNVAELSDAVKQQIVNVRVVEQELKRLQAQRAIANVARSAYAGAVSKAMPKVATPPADGAKSAVINGVTHDWASLGERVQGLIVGIRAADQQLARLNAQTQLAQAARGTFAQVVKRNLPKRKPA